MRETSTEDIQWALLGYASISISVFICMYINILYVVIRTNIQ